MQIESEEQPLDITKLKYVLYARKSEVDESRQVRSIPDQIFDCKLLVARRKLNIVTQLEESQSAKTPGKRPIFNQMIKDIEKGVYDGILAWNPDRLARNMLEGGKIINMIDEGKLKDLQFHTHYFENNANGKMLLGMAFVLSKQYSDDLSQKVTRSSNRKFSEGKSSIPKHGYILKKSLYEPDGKNFDLISQAWEKRLKGVSLDNIAEFLTKSGYKRKTVAGREIKLNNKILSDLFKDPFYLGVLIRGNQEVRLQDFYDFKPIVTEEEYNSVQNPTNRRIPIKAHGKTFYPFRAMVVCSFCGRNMVPAPATGGSGIRYLSFRCDTFGCERKKKAIRTNNLLSYIYDFLEDGLNFTKAEYEKYSDEITKEAATKQERLKIEIHSRQGRLVGVGRQLKELALGMTKLEKGTRIWKLNEERANELEAEEKTLEEDIGDIKALQTDPEKDKLSIEQVLNLSKNAGRAIEAAEPLQKDRLCRFIFLNFTVDEEKVLSHQLKEPFDTLVKMHNSVSGRGDRT